MWKQYINRNYYQIFKSKIYFDEILFILYKLIFLFKTYFLIMTSLSSIDDAVLINSI
jgi:hypothetical protein